MSAEDPNAWLTPDDMALLEGSQVSEATANDSCKDCAVRELYKGYDGTEEFSKEKCEHFKDVPQSAGLDVKCGFAAMLAINAAMEGKP